MGLLQSGKALAEQARALYVTIRRQEGITRQMLSDQLGLPATTLNRALDKQIRLGLIEEYDWADSTGGRRPGLYRVVADARYLLGLHLGLESGELVLTDLLLRPLGRSLLPGIETILIEGLEKTVRQAVIDLAGERAPDKLLGLGFNQSAWHLEPDLTAACQALQQALGIPVMNLSGTEPALFAALWLEGSAGSDHVLYLSLGDAIRASVVRRGTLHPEPLDVRQLDTWQAADPDSIGYCRLAHVCARPGILRRFRQIKHDAELTWPDFSKAALAGKKKAGRVLQEAAQAAAACAVNLNTLAGGTRLMLSGSLIEECPELLVLFRQELGNFASSGASIPLLLEYPHDCGILALGCAAYVLETSLADH